MKRLLCRVLCHIGWHDPEVLPTQWEFNPDDMIHVFTQTKRCSRCHKVLLEIVNTLDD